MSTQHRPRPSFSPGRPLDLFHLPLLLGGVVMLGFAAWILLRGPGEVQIGGTGSSGQPITVTSVDASLDTHPDLDVYVDVPPTDEAGCTDRDGKRAHQLAVMPRQGDLTVDGARWFGAGIKVPTQPGEQVTCTVEGASKVLLVHRTGMYRVLQAGLFAVAGAGGLLLGIIGWVLARRRRQRATA